MVSRTERINQLVAIRRGGPRRAVAGRGLAEAGGRPEPDLWHWRGVREGELAEASGRLC